MGKHIGYVRVSTKDQDLSLQINELTAAGCERIFTNKVSGAKSQHPGLDDCLKTLRKGDSLVVWRLDRLRRSIQHLVSVVTDLKAKDSDLSGMERLKRLRRPVSLFSTSWLRWRNSSVS
jgi:DNA invertase Pin-like site-specific DNA recombinase